MSDLPPGLDYALLSGVIGRRLVAWVIDLVIVGIATALLAGVVFLLGILTFGLAWLLLGGLWVLPVLYAWLFVAAAGHATPGQSLAGIVVVDDATLGPPTPVQALVWSVIYALTAPLSGGILLLLVFVTRHKRALHDLASGLTVVRADAARQVPPMTA